MEKLVDALGGVTVYVKDMKYQDDSQHLYINLKAGKSSEWKSSAIAALSLRRKWRYRSDSAAANSNACLDGTSAQPSYALATAQNSLGNPVTSTPT